MWDLGIPQHADTLIYEDNDACTAMANAQKPTPRTHHIDIKYFALAEWVERDLLTLGCVDTSINMADNFTKPLNCISSIAIQILFLAISRNNILQCTRELLEH